MGSYTVETPTAALRFKKGRLQQLFTIDKRGSEGFAVCHEWRDVPTAENEND
jgi:hypothetical protein